MSGSLRSQLKFRTIKSFLVVKFTLGTPKLSCFYEISVRSDRNIYKDSKLVGVECAGISGSLKPIKKFESHAKGRGMRFSLNFYNVEKCKTKGNLLLSGSNYKVSNLKLVSPQNFPFKVTSPKTNNQQTLTYPVRNENLSSLGPFTFPYLHRSIF